VRAFTSYGYVESVKTHTIEDWVAFLRSVVINARSLGHKPVRVQFDRAPVLQSVDLRRRVEKKLGLIVELTPREHHQGVGRAERHHDILTRAAKAMLQRTEMGTSWLLPAREYANYLENRTVHTPTAMTKYRRYYGSVPSFVDNVPLIFGTQVVVVEAVRGPKGSLDAPRGSTGRFVGVSGSSKLVYRELRLNTVAQHKVQPLNELALVRSSLPSAVASVDSATQTDCVAAPPAPAAAPPAHSVIATVDIPLGARVEVKWLFAASEGALPAAWYTGTIVDVRTYASGRRRHYVTYDGFPDERFLHDFASDDFEWRRVDGGTALPCVAPAQPQSLAPPGTAPSPPPPGPVTRARRAAAAQAVLERPPAPLHAEAFNTALFQALGPASDTYA